MDFEVRAATADDSDDVDRIAKECFIESFDKGFLRSFMEHWADGQLVATIDGKVIGFLCGAIIDETTTSIALMAVLQENRMSGIGSIMVDVFEQATEAYGCTYMQLEVRKDNVAAFEFYSYLGFNENMTDLPNHYSDGCDGIRMGITCESYLLPE